MEILSQVTLLASRNYRAGDQMKATIPNTNQKPTAVHRGQGQRRLFCKRWTVEGSRLEGLNSLCHINSTPTVVV